MEWEMLLSSVVFDQSFVDRLSAMIFKTIGMGAGTGLMLFGIILSFAVVRFIFKQISKL